MRTSLDDLLGRSTLLTIARRCGGEPSLEQLTQAVDVQRAGAEAVRRARPGALQMLRTLRGEGYGLALLSDCSSELVEAWSHTPFASYLDATVFSFHEGRRKPDPRLYATAASRLGVAPHECWYVGDGGSRELQGALAAGMRPVLVANTRVPGAAAHRDDPDPWRPDHVIDDVTELTALVGASLAR